MEERTGVPGEKHLGRGKENEGEVPTAWTTAAEMARCLTGKWVGKVSDGDRDADGDGGNDKDDGGDVHDDGDCGDGVCVGHGAAAGGDNGDDSHSRGIMDGADSLEGS